MKVMQPVEDQLRETRGLVNFILNESKKKDLKEKEPDFFRLLTAVHEQCENAVINLPEMFLLGFRWSEIAQKYGIVTNFRQQSAGSHLRPNARKIPSKAVLESAAARFLKKYETKHGIVQWLAKEFDTSPGTVRRTALDYQVDLKHFSLKG